MIYTTKQILSIALVTWLLFATVTCTYVFATESSRDDEPVIIERCCFPELKSLNNDEPTPSLEEKIAIFKDAVEREPEPTYTYYDIPLSEDLQTHIFKTCEERNIDIPMVIGIIETESTFDPNNVSDGGNSLGLMQIQPRWHSDRMAKLNCMDLMDPYQNVTVGIDYLAELYSYAGRARSTEWVLMAYNGGPAYANRKTANGEITNYVRLVLQRSKDLKVI